MLRSTAALALLVVFALVAFGWRTWVQVRRHGDSGWRITPGGGPVAVLAHGSFVVSLVLLVAAPVAALLTGEPHLPGGTDALTTGPTGTVTAVAGTAVMVLGTALVVAAQVQMGASWRIGVDEGEVTDLVTTGLFAKVRNPIFTGMLAGTAGLALMVPNALALAALVTELVGLHLQVRKVEEPYLRGVHGTAYERWAAGAGRFLPFTGRLEAGRS